MILADRVPFVFRVAADRYGSDLRRQTNERDFPVPSQPRCGDRHSSATRGGSNFHQLTREGKTMSILSVGVDLAKNVFALHGVNAAGALQLRQPKVARDHEITGSGLLLPSRAKT